MTDIDNAFEKFQSRIAQLQAELHQAQVLLKAIGASENADILKLQADYNSSQQTVQRLHDLVRYKRSELLNDDLISMDEYAELAQDHAAVARLEGYDSALKKIRESSEQTVRELNAAIEQLRVEEKQLDRALSELADARKDTERLDWLETERIREQEYLDGKRQWTGPALFRQNMLITRNIIDAARAATDTSLKDKR